MRALLTREGRRYLSALCGSPLLVAFDFDGTLAPLMDRPERVYFYPQTKQLFRAVALRYPVAVVSGRSLADLAPRLADSGVRWIVGNHGAEESDRPPVVEQVGQVVAWRKWLEAHLDQLGDVWLEDKGSSLSVHLRGAHPAASAARVRHRLEPLSGVRVLGGKRILNLVPESAPDKGDAVLGLMRRAGCAAVLYVGDDVTDEDVFARAGEANVCGVRVGRSKHSRAQWWISQAQVDALLEQLVALRL